MTSRVKEDERIEKIIRGLLKLQENRRCINCNSLGPQYVCTTFLTFVCTTCSGVHREFTHRVKSVSMAKFNAEEVSALQAGGNERAREIYFKAWDPQRHSYPECSNLHRIREFIRHVYVDRKYTGERYLDKLPRLKMEEKEDCNKKVEMYERRYGERSSFNGRNDDKSFKYYYDERRSPRFAQQNNRYGGYKRSPVRFEVVDDRFRDDGFGSGRRSDSSRFSNVESVSGSSSPESSKNVDVTKSIVVRPVSDILGEDAPPLKVGEVRTSINRRDAGGSAFNLKIAALASNMKSITIAPPSNVKSANNAPSNNVKNAEGKSLESRSISSGSLMDLNNTNPQPPNAIRGGPQEQKEPLASNWAAFGSSEKEKVDQPPKENTLEALFSLLIDPPPAPTRDTQELLRSKTAPIAALANNILPLAVDGGSLATHGHDVSAIPQDIGSSANSSSSNLLTPDESSAVDAFNTDKPSIFTIPHTDGRAATTSTPGTSSNFPVEPTSGTSLSAASTNEGAYVATSEKSISSPNSNDDNSHLTSRHERSSQQTQPSAYSGMDVCLTAEPTPPWVGTSDDNVWALSLISNSDEPSTISAEQSSELNSKQGPDASTGGGKQSTEVKLSGRKELPMDLFTSSYSAVPAPVPHWQSIQHHVMGFNGQYHHPAALHRPTFPNPTKSTNPFDLSSGTTQDAMFPPMAPFQEALSTISVPTGLYNTSNMGNQPLQLMRPQSPSYPSSLPSGSPSYASSFYMEQQGPSNMSPSGVHGSASFGTGEADYSSFHTNQQPTGGYNAGVSSANSFPSRGVNPFG